MFNVVGLVVISIILAFASQTIINGIMGISGSGDFKRFVANADTLFKVFQTIILFPCSGLLVKLSKKVIHSKGNEEHDENEMVLKYIGVSGAPSSSTAMVEIVQ